MRLPFLIRTQTIYGLHNRNSISFDYVCKCRQRRIMYVVLRSDRFVRIAMIITATPTSGALYSMFLRGFRFTYYRSSVIRMIHI